MNTDIFVFARSRRLAGLIPLLCLTFLIGGCGRKTLPKPMSEEAPPQIKNFQAQVRSKSVELSWTIPDEPKRFAKQSSYQYSVLRSELKWENRSCLDCPAPTEEEIRVIDPAFLNDARLEEHTITWNDASVSHQHAYRYRVSLLDSKKHTLSSSRPVAVSVVPPPGNIKDLAAKTGPQGILLQWKPPTKDEQGQPLQGDLSFIIERHTPRGSWEKVTNVPIKANNYLDSAVASKQAYDYRVTPVLFLDETRVFGAPAMMHQARAPEALPPPPPGKVWAIPTKGALEVHWVGSDAKVGGYHVYRKEGKEIIRLTSSPIERPPYVDRSIRHNAVYSYAVSAVSAPPEEREGLLSKWAEIRSLMIE